jgi:hypothetical protein
MFLQNTTISLIKISPNLTRADFYVEINFYFKMFPILVILLVYNVQNTVVWNPQHKPHTLYRTGFEFL